MGWKGEKRGAYGEWILGCFLELFHGKNGGAPGQLRSSRFRIFFLFPPREPSMVLCMLLYVGNANVEFYGPIVDFASPTFFRLLPLSMTSKHRKIMLDNVGLRALLS